MTGTGGQHRETRGGFLRAVCPSRVVLVVTYSPPISTILFPSWYTNCRLPAVAGYWHLRLLLPAVMLCRVSLRRGAERYGLQTCLETVFRARAMITGGVCRCRGRGTGELSGYWY